MFHMKQLMRQQKRPPYQIQNKRGRGYIKMRTIYAIQKDIDRTTTMLKRLLLEKKLTVQQLEGLKASSEILTEKLIERLRHVEGCGK